MLKQFIDNRINFALNKEEIDFEGNPWDFLFENQVVTMIVVLNM